MTSSDKKKSAILVLLVIVAVGTWWWMYGSTATTSKNATAAKAAKKVPGLSPTQDSQIRTDLIVDTSSREVGRRNLFAYKPKAAPPKPQEVIRIITPPVGPPTPPAPPPIYVAPIQPFKPFKYEGFSVNRGNGKLLGSISESGNTYKVAEGDCVMGQYCITRLTETQVEIEDLQLKRKQTFTRAQ